MLAHWMATPTALSSQEEQRQVLVDRSQEHVEAPGGHEEEERRDQRDDEPQAEGRDIRDGHLVDLLRVTQPDMPQRIGEHGRQDEREVEAARDPGHLVLRRGDR